MLSFLSKKCDAQTARKTVNVRSHEGSSRVSLTFNFSHSLDRIAADHWKLAYESSWDFKQPCPEGLLEIRNGGTETSPKNISKIFFLIKIGGTLKRCLKNYPTEGQTNEHSLSEKCRLSIYRLVSKFYIQYMVRAWYCVHWRLMLEHLSYHTRNDKFVFQPCFAFCGNDIFKS